MDEEKSKNFNIKFINTRTQIARLKESEYTGVPLHVSLLSLENNH
jgi:hypothetical protein